MKDQIREILWNFVAGEVTDSEAVQQVLNLLDVVWRSEQLTAFNEWLDDNHHSFKIPDIVIQDYIQLLEGKGLALHKHEVGSSVCDHYFELAYSDTSGNHYKPCEFCNKPHPTRPAN